MWTVCKSCASVWSAEIVGRAKGKKYYNETYLQQQEDAPLMRLWLGREAPWILFDGRLYYGGVLTGETLYGQRVFVAHCQHKDKCSGELKYVELPTAGQCLVLPRSDKHHKVECKAMLYVSFMVG